MLITFIVVKIINKSNLTHSTAQKKLTTFSERPSGSISRKGATASSIEHKKNVQIRGFTRCMKLWYHTMRINCNEEQTFSYLSNKLRKFDLHQLPKAFKTSCANYFSFIMEQELTSDADLYSVELVEPHFQKLLKKRWQRPRRKVRDLWNLLQVKVAANEVPSEMVLKAYKSHQETLSTMGSTPEHVLQHVQLYARQFAERVKGIYQEQIPLPPSKACFSHNRDQGGSFGSLKDQQRVPLSRVNNLLSLESTRIDPPMIYIKGSPGIGKSFLTNLVAKELSSRFGEKTSVYPRNFDSKHFDGYHGQLIFQVDDAFQKDGKQEGDELIDQIIQIKSNNEFVVPMADIKNKGRKFTSEFLLLSSNICPTTLCSAYGQNIGIRCPKALLRRLVPFWEIHERKHDGTYRVSFNSYQTDDTSSSCDPDNIRNIRVKREFYMEISLHRLVNMITEKALSQHRDAVSSAYLSVGLERPSIWRIPVMKHSSSEQPCLAYEFPCTPPPVNEVKAHAICEPLKVRMITKGDSRCFALKPLQVAMFKALKSYKCFFPGTKNEDTELKVKSLLDGKKGFILSGDYTAATDNLNMDIMDVFVKELKKQFIDHPTLCRYLDYEGGQHRIQYPKWTKLEPIVQTKGQLMGSLISFPILCVANAATIGLVEKKDELSDVEAVINGDDILFVSSDRKIRSWKRVSASMGLTPSVGKNYQSQFFGSINSQLFIRSKKTTQFRVIDTGKFNTILSKNVLDTKAAFEHGFSAADIVSFSERQLKLTPQSLDIPLEYGGLGVEFNPLREPTRVDRKIYLQKICELSDVRRIGEFPEMGVTIISGPKYFLKDYFKFKISNQQIVNRIRCYETSQQETLLTLAKHENVFYFDKKTQKRIQANPVLRDFLNKGNLSKSLPLSLMKSVTLGIPSNYFDSIQTNVKSRIFRLLS